MKENYFTSRGLDQSSYALNVSACRSARIQFLLKNLIPPRNVNPNSLEEPIPPRCKIPIPLSTIIPSCPGRLLLDILPGLEILTLQETDGLIPQLYKWVDAKIEPLASYATGLLAVAMELSEVWRGIKDFSWK